ncbi:hypothetical protein KI387_023925, partial [Taxus chinensis]
ELLELMGMPVLRAEGEAEALCAQLDREGWVDACLTTDSDAFLHGAKCVIKCLRVDCKECIIECYRASDIDTGLRLKRKHLIALALLLGCDYNTHGVPGIGLKTAVHIVHLFQEEEILDKLRELGKGNQLLLSEMDNFRTDYVESDHDAGMPVKKRPHCSHCGHPGNKVNHLKLGCDVCKDLYKEEKCVQKSRGWKCECASCMQEQRRKEQNKCLQWKTRLFNKICATDGFPNEEIVNMFIGHKTSALDLQKFVKSLSWHAPQMDFLEDFLGHHLYWHRPYTRWKILPLCSVLVLRRMAADKAEVNAPDKSWLLYNRYTPHSIERVKVRYSQSFYVLKWKHVKAESANDDWLCLKSKVFQLQKRKAKICNFQIGCDEDFHAVEVDTIKGGLFISTDEDMELVRSACPKLVENFEYEKTIKKRNGAISKPSQGREASTRKQRNITSYFKATKGLATSKARVIMLTVGNNQDGNTRANLNLRVPLEKPVESINAPLPFLNDPVSQVEA